MTDTLQIPTREQVVDAVLPLLPENVERAPLNGFKHLVAFRHNVGYAVVYDGPEACDLTEEVEEQLLAEARSGLLLDQLVVFSRFNLFHTDDIEWHQFPAEVMRAIPKPEPGPPPVTVTGHRAKIDYRVDFDAGGRTMLDRHGREMRPERIEAELHIEPDGVRLYSLAVEGEALPPSGGYAIKPYNMSTLTFHCTVFDDPNAPEWLVDMARRIVRSVSIDLEA